ncbi:hypothetical protein B484DRAFT_408888, partial [Ochromonadaceae sp. CCMP2298]
VNLGPLLYHWAADTEHSNDPEHLSDSRFDQSIELSYEELKLVIQSFGLVLLQER